MQELIANLTRMRCESFLAQPWPLKNETMVKELVEEPTNQWDNTFRGHSNLWTTKIKADVSNFIQQGMGWAAKLNRFVQGKFIGKINPNDGYLLTNSRDPRARHVLAFLVLILYPEKLAMITLTVVNTIFGALTGQREANWALIIQDVIQKLLLGIGRKPSPITPFLLHLYEKYGCFVEKEEEDLKVARHVMDF